MTVEQLKCLVLGYVKEPFYLQFNMKNDETLEDLLMKIVNWKEKLNKANSSVR